ncbi:MAG: MATE family efflux transporter [Coriobacteriales bacterium]|nr:MATE family efflux transporter [Coriobacteriales bacterium]
MAMQLDMEQLAQGESPSRRELAKLVFSLSLPTILAEFAVIAMEYIDAAMVGSLGAEATAAIGLVASSTWLVGGLCAASSVGFSVQIAQHVGAGEYCRARNVLRQSIIVLMAFSVLLTIITVAISSSLPYWLGGEGTPAEEGVLYFLVFSIATPALMLERIGVGALQCAGDMRTPSVWSALACLLDVLFNLVLIFPSTTYEIFGLHIFVPGCDLGVLGAALGTSAAELFVGVVLMWFACVKSPMLRLVGTPEERFLTNDAQECWHVESRCCKIALKIASPIMFERVVMNGAQVVQTAIVAPLKTTALAANSLAITAEGLCYMPGYGIATAATTLVGQSFGAGRRDLAKQFANLTTVFGMVIMGVTALIMFFAAPFVMSLLTPVVAVQELGALSLRAGLIAEPLFGASIVAAGALRGAGDTLIPSIMNLICMWGIRIPLAIFMAGAYGLVGVWVAMAIELCVRGTIFLIRLLRGTWLKRTSITQA